MKRQQWIKAAAVVALAGGLGGWCLPAQAAEAQRSERQGRLVATLADLGITEEQRAQIKAILADVKPQAEPLIKQLVTERRALRGLIQKGASETEIRARASRVAAVATDLAVLRARTAPQIRAVLTPEQRSKLQERWAEWDRRVDAFLERLGN